MSHVKKSTQMSCSAAQLNQPHPNIMETLAIMMEAKKAKEKSTAEDLPAVSTEKQCMDVAWSVKHVLLLPALAISPPLCCVVVNYVINLFLYPRTAAHELLHLLVLPKHHLREFNTEPAQQIAAEQKPALELVSLFISPTPSPLLFVSVLPPSIWVSGFVSLSSVLLFVQVSHWAALTLRPGPGLGALVFARVLRLSLATLGLDLGLFPYLAAATFPLHLALALAALGLGLGLGLGLASPLPLIISTCPAIAVLHTLVPRVVVAAAHSARTATRTMAVAIRSTTATTTQLTNFPKFPDSFGVSHIRSSTSAHRLRYPTATAQSLIKGKKPLRKEREEKRIQNDGEDTDDDEETLRRHKVKVNTASGQDVPRATAAKSAPSASSITKTKPTAVQKKCKEPEPLSEEETPREQSEEPPAKKTKPRLKMVSTPHPASDSPNVATRPLPSPEPKNSSAPSPPHSVDAAAPQVNEPIASGSTSPPVAETSHTPVTSTSTNSSKATNSTANETGSRIVSATKKRIFIPPNPGRELRSRNPI
ncbi:hypothetical protein BDV93DRAFT_559965 [Ceratobasidium sp. AG-I]|nr:hypothetical protein BDV93DRAFT_559965 [Ceratobasidium sp. AG-I]